MESNNNSSLEALSKSIQLGEEIFIKISQNEKLELEQKIVLALYWKLLEQADGNYVVADAELLSSSKVMIRATFETYLGIKYILHQKNRIKDRALSYYVGYLKAHWIAAQEVLNKPVEGVEEATCREMIAECQKILGNRKYKRILDEWENTKRSLQIPHDPKWYSLFRGPRSIKQLVQKVGDEEDYRFYGLISQESHGYQALNVLYGLDLENAPFEFKPIRREKSDFGFQEELARALVISAAGSIIYELFPSYEDDYVKLAREIGVLPKALPYKTDQIEKPS